MITAKQFDDRVKKLYASQKKMASPRKWKSGRRAGVIRHPGFVVEFSEAQLRSVLMAKVGFNLILCPYCKQPIDILSLTLDHIVPRSLGGTFTLPNMQCTCVDCNTRKGSMTHEGFMFLITFARKGLGAHDFDVFWKRLKGTNSNHAFQHFRKQNDQQQGNALPPAAEQMQMEKEF